MNHYVYLGLKTLFYKSNVLSLFFIKSNLLLSLVTILKSNTL